MNFARIYKKRSFVVYTVYALILGICLCAGGYAGRDFFSASLPDSIQGRLANFPWAVSGLDWLSVHGLAFWALGGLVCVVLLLLSWIAWFLVSLAVAAGLKKAQEQFALQASSQIPGKKDFIDQRLEHDRKRRIFLHLLSVLQREGRLLDFFAEDLSLYEDEQIGAAVRSIHEDCKKALHRYIVPKAVMDAEEGDKVTIEKGFDMDSIVLVGNVSGEPPFEGIVRHPGWRAGKKEVPGLSDIQDSGILMPAQIEIL